MSALPIHVDFCTALRELCRLLFQSLLNRCFFCYALLCRILAHVLSNFHGTEVRAAHGTEVCGLGAFLRQGFVVELARGFGIERQVKLIFPSELEARFRDRIISILRSRMSLR